MKTDVMFIGVGGQGILTAIGVLGETAIITDTNVIMSEVHGMAQRGGTVEAHIRLGDVHGPLIPDRSADALVAFEPIEALRRIEKVSPDGVVLVNTSPIYPFTVSLGEVDYPPIERIVETLEGIVSRVIAFDALEIAKGVGSLRAVNMVMLGGLVGTGVLPFTTDRIREGISNKIKEKALESSLKAFDIGVDKASALFTD